MKRVLLLGLLLVLSGCAPVATTASPAVPTDTPIASTRTIVDSFGREVVIPTDVKSIVCTGSGALRVISYLNRTDLLVGVEDTDKGYESSSLRDYAYINHNLFDSLPSIGKGGGTGNTAYAEELIALQPDVILTAYNEEALAELEQTTGIPCVSIRYKSINFVDESFYSAMKIAANVLGAQDRCSDVLTFIDNCKADLTARTADIPEEEKPSAYTGAVTFSGAHGFTGTYANFGPFMGIGANNVADRTDATGYFDADPEAIVSWDPMLIFLDPGNLDLVKDEYRTNPGFFRSLNAVQQGQVYAQISFNNYSTNVGYALANSYYAGMVMFPDHFSELEIASKTNEILEVLLGEGYYDDMISHGLAFGVIDIGA